MKKLLNCLVLGVLLGGVLLFSDAQAQPVYKTIKNSNVPDSRINELSALEYEMRVFEEKADTMLQRIDDLVSELEFLRSRNNEYIKIMAAKENQIYDLRKQLSEVEAAKSDTAQAIAQYGSQIGSLKLALADKDKEIEQLKKSIDSRNKGLENKIQVLEADSSAQEKKFAADITAKDTTISAMQREMADLREKRSLLEQANKQSIDSAAELTEKLDTRDKELAVLRKQLGRQKDVFDEENRQLKENYRQSAGKARDLEVETARYKKENQANLKTIENLKGDLEKNRKSRLALEKELNRQRRMSSRLKGEDAKEIAREALQSDYQDLQSQIEQYRQTVKDLESRIVEKDKIIDSSSEAGDALTPTGSSLDKLIAVKNTRIAELQKELDKYRGGSSQHVKTVAEMERKLKARGDELFVLQKKFIAMKNELASIKADKSVDDAGVNNKDKQIDNLKKQLQISQSRFEKSSADYKTKIERLESELVTAKQGLGQKGGVAPSSAASGIEADEKDKELRLLHSKLQQARLSQQEISLQVKKQKESYERQIAELAQQIKDSDLKIAPIGDKDSVAAVESDRNKEDAVTAGKKMVHLRSTLTELFKKEISENKIKLNSDKGNIVISVFSDVLFDSGKNEVRFSSIPLLNKIGKVFNDQAAGYKIVVEGHTDNQPILYSQWKSNWELSSARALSVLHYFINECAVASTRLSLCGFGEFKPLAGNDTEAGRQINRRVEIILVP